jgi:hypothetical protein
VERGALRMRNLVTEWPIAEVRVADDMSEELAAKLLRAIDEAVRDTLEAEAERERRSA